MRPHLGGSWSPRGAAGSLPSVVDFPSQRREKIDWHKLASIDFSDLSSGCSVDILQENLSHVAFCDAEAEFELSTTSGRRSLLKMFRLAQLIVQYLFLSQDFIETQLKEAQDEVNQAVDKYQQMKSKLIQQVEEAKKLRTTNRNMRETVKYVNSFALANGIFQALRCPVCPKTFRSRDYLHSHVWRKHPDQAHSVVVHPSSIQIQVPSAATMAPSVATDTRDIPHVSDTALNSAPSVTSPKTNDVDSYRLNEIERKFDTMNDNFSRMLREIEEQKRVLEKENEKKQEEVKKAWEEKASLEKGYEAQLERLGQQISYLQNSTQDHSNPKERDKIFELVKRQEEEIKSLRLQMENRSESQVEDFRQLDEVDGLNTELKTLKKQLSEQKKQHKQALREMQANLQKDYENAMSSEKDKLREMMKDIAHEEASMAMSSRKPPPSPSTHGKVKSPTPSRATKSPVESYTTHKSSSESSPSPPPARTNGVAKLQRMNTMEPESNTESESETDTSHWNQTDLRVTHLQIGSPNTKREEDSRVMGPIRPPESEEISEESTEDSEEESVSESEETSESFSLEALLRDNPKLWDQMRAATSDVLASKLAALGIHKSDKGIKADVLTSCLSKLRKDRRELEKKHENFLDLRKRLENEVRAKVDDKIDKVEDTSATQGGLSNPDGQNNRKQSGVLGRMMKNVQSRVKERSKAITSSVSKTGDSVKSGVMDIFQVTPKSGSDVQAIGRSRRVSVVSGDKTENGESEISSTESDEESDGPKSTRIEIHNETSNSVSRNVFGGGSSRNVFGGGSSRVIKPKRGGYFENKTYGQANAEDSDSDSWDSDPEYENVRKAQPPVRSDSLKYSLEPTDLHTSSWDAEKPKPIKLKQASGENVSSLTRTIEMQLSGRKKEKPAGAVDVMNTSGVEQNFPGSSGLGESIPGSSGLGGNSPGPSNPKHSIPYGSRTTMNSPSESSNTVRTSMWGSADNVDKIGRKGSKASTSKAAIHSWDSEEDLNISDLE